ncbi:LOW QUALITY PROTEIN: metabotropic glutamate receptor-like [Lepeophtheirus salmonis]|uniref:LOW QUALITY PROTEIN: metabotropic glutamate receptor-like n=1 Tax=Lepeophtheirus salmonis TaxID=72036 RepID=UPI003AF3A376
MTYSIIKWAYCILSIFAMKHIWIGIDGKTTTRGVTLTGNIILGGLFPVHEKSVRPEIPCSHKVYNRGIQRLEAMLYAVDTINNDDNLLKDIRIGVNILDTCGRDAYALNQSLEFIRTSLNSFDDVNRYECVMSGEMPRAKFNTTGPVLGVIGGSYSSVSIQVANLLRLFSIPQISPASTAKELSDKSRYEMFARTVPPDTFQAIALVDIVVKFNWSYVSTVASEGSYGESGMDVFRREASHRNICIAVAEKVPSSSDEKTFIEVVQNLLKKPNAKAIVLFTRAEDARGIVKAARKLLGTSLRRFYWLASDGWGKQAAVLDGIEDFAVGAITVELESKKLTGFDEYMNTLTPKTNIRNLWFKDYWEDMFNCRVKMDGIKRKHRRSGWVPKHKRNLPICDPKQRLLDLQGYEQDSKVQFVIDGVYAFAHALDKLKSDICPHWKGICPAMKAYKGGDFYKNYLLKVDFKDMVNSTVKFDDKGDGPARYMIYNYQRNPDNNTVYKIIGKWYHKLQMNVSDIMWTDPILSRANLNASEIRVGPNEYPKSVCSLPCKIGEIMIMSTGDTCCWICQKCQDYEYMEDEFTCKDCGNGRWPHNNKSLCYDLELQYMDWTTVYAIIPIVISTIGILLTLATLCIFIKYRDTPLVRASGRELSYVILSGLLLCYLNTFILIAPPGIIICTIQRFTVGMGFSFTYGALLTKTNRISRIFHSAATSARRPSYISPRSQLMITSVLVSLQFFATLIWIFAAFPAAIKVYPQRHDVILKCNVNDSSFLISQIYNMILITICTYYAIMTRKVPENFNEAKFIGFTMYTTCIIWIALIVIYFGTSNSFKLQITTMCISISLSAYVTLICLFSPKIYIIVFQPEKNVRKLTMNSGAYKKVATSIVSGNVSHSAGSHLNQTNNSIVKAVDTSSRIGTDKKVNHNSKSLMSSMDDTNKKSGTNSSFTNNGNQAQSNGQLERPKKITFNDEDKSESYRQRIQKGNLPQTSNVSIQIPSFTSPSANDYPSWIASKGEHFREENNLLLGEPKEEEEEDEEYEDEECFSCCSSSCSNKRLEDDENDHRRQYLAKEAAKLVLVSRSSDDILRVVHRSRRQARESICSTQSSPRHLMTYVTSSLETVPLEMCQDIPDVLL